MNPWEHRTSNIQHPTSNTQPPINGIGNHWLFDVGCWVLDVFLRFMGSMREFFGEFSPHSFVVGRGRKAGSETFRTLRRISTIAVQRTRRLAPRNAEADF